MFIPAMPAGQVASAPPFAVQLAGGLRAPVRRALTRRSHERLDLTRMHLNVLAGRTASVAGGLRPRLRDAHVVLQVLHDRRWLVVAHAHTGARGRFHLRFAPHRTGSWRAQVHLRGAARAKPAIRHVGRLRSYRLAGASWYTGAGRMACGGYLTTATLGVANKTLPCGTRVTLRYHRHVISVPVVDRGPYVAGREFDLTEATKRALGFEGVGQVWATR